MTNILVSKAVAQLTGTVHVPGDKSISHRTLMFGALASGETTAKGVLEGEDVLRTGKALVAMGAEIYPPLSPEDAGIWRIHGVGAKGLRAPHHTLDLGNSGTSARLLMGVIGGYPLQATIIGDASLSKRPMGRVIKPLARMGVQFETSQGDRIPLKVSGSETLRAINYELPMASAQVKSAILLAGLRSAGTTTIIEPKKTRDHTERMLRFFGIDVQTELLEDGRHIAHVTGGGRLVGQQVNVPSDPSSAAFPLVAALITPDSDVTLPNVMMNPTRIGLFATLQEMGADITFKAQREKSGEDIADIHVRSSALKGVDVPPARNPSMIDEFPILAVAAAFAEGKTVMRDLGELRVKESDRLTATANILKQAGVKIEVAEDTLTVYGQGGAQLPGGCTIDACHDHRIAMSSLVMAMRCVEPITVTGAETIKTSFPGFVDTMNILGANISTVDDASCAA